MPDQDLERRLADIQLQLQRQVFFQRLSVLASLGALGLGLYQLLQQPAPPPRITMYLDEC